MFLHTIAVLLLRYCSVAGALLAEVPIESTREGFENKITELNHELLNRINASLDR
jgi:hypothetical protein